MASDALKERLFLCTTRQPSSPTSQDRDSAHLHVAVNHSTAVDGYAFAEGLAPGTYVWVARVDLGPDGRIHEWLLYPVSSRGLERFVGSDRAGDQGPLTNAVFAARRSGKDDETIMAIVRTALENFSL